MIQLMGKKVPDPLAVEHLLPLFERSLFPRWHEPAPLELLLQRLSDVLKDLSEFKDFDASALAHHIIRSLDGIRDQLILDAQLSLEGDPAANSLQEIILAYPGFRATLVYRVANSMMSLGIPLLPRMLSESIHSRTGIDIHPGAQIETPFFIDHGTGVVIGQTAVVGKNVHIYQGVTLGALAVKKADAGVKRHPTIGDNVVIYANSTILGGNTEIGHDSVIGGNTWLTTSVPPYSVVYTEHKTIVRDRDTYVQPIDFSI